MKSLASRRIAKAMAQLTFRQRGSHQSYASVLDIHHSQSASQPVDAPEIKNVASSSRDAGFFNRSSDELIRTQSVNHSLSKSKHKLYTDEYILGEPNSLNLFEHMEELRETSVKLRCTVIDARGDIARADVKEFRKSDLCSKFGLQARDLRKVDTAVANAVPTILVRRHCILVNILHIRALITGSSVLLFDAAGSRVSSGETALLRSLQIALRQFGHSNHLPYEQRCLETILATVTTVLHKELDGLKNMVVQLLQDLEFNIVPEKLRLLLAYTRKIAALHKRAALVREAIDELLEQDEDLNGLYLSNPRSLELGLDHQEAEMLLETYSKQVEEIVNEIDSLSANVEQTKEVCELILDASRNELMGLELRVSIGTMGMASGALIASLFGMNLAHSFESHPAAFGWVTVGAVGISGLVMSAGFRRLRALRRVGIGQRFKDHCDAHRKQLLARNRPKHIK